MSLRKFAGLRATRWLDAVLLVTVMVVATGVYVPAATRVGYNTDEGQFIAAAEFFDIAFIRRDLLGPAWGTHYYTLTQPMLSRFIIGAGIRFAGVPSPSLDIHHREAEVNPSTRGRYLQPETYRDERKLAEERRVDRPAASTLQAARAPMALLSVVGMGLLYVCGRLIGGPLAGLIAAGVAIWNPTMQTLLPRAHAEAPLFVFTLAAVTLGLLAARSIPGRSSLLLGLTGGLMAGLAVSAKLTGALVVASLGVYALLALLAWGMTRGLVAAMAWRWSTIAVITAVVVMLALNPFLYRDPVGRTRDMLAFRQQEMFGQAMLSENEAVPAGLENRLPLTLERSMVELATLSQRTGAPLDVPLIALGLVVLLTRIVRQRRLEAVFGPEVLLLVMCATIMLGLALNLGINWTRYFMPLLTITPLLLAIGTVSALSAIRAIARAT